VAAALWWGSLTAIGFIAVPLLFAHLPSPQLAGQAAARLFTAQSWVSLGCGVLLLLLARGKQALARMDWAQGALVFVASGLLLAMLLEHGVAPRIVAREDLRLWHSVGSGMYLLQWVCALTVLLKLSRHPRAGGDPGSAEALGPRLRGDDGS
jgi:hypothetical protein